jgi:ELWxxDGT repeat protein
MSRINGSTLPRRAFVGSGAFMLAFQVAVVSAMPVAAASAPYLVKNIRSGSADSIPVEITALGNVVLFSARAGGLGRELWRSDGTALGTYRILDIRPGKRSSSPSGLVKIGDKVFFSANDGPHGTELWATDGTSAGTHLVKDIVPGKTGSICCGDDAVPIAVDGAGLVFFTATPEERLWRSDGTNAGTFPVPGSPRYLQNLASFGTRVYFGAEDKMWRSDGTATGTKPVKNSNGFYVKEPAEIVATDSYVFFEYNETKLWRTDGTAAGTFKILDRGSGCSYNSEAMMLTRAGDLVFFTPLGGVVGTEVWRSDGTVGGTFKAGEPGSWSSESFHPVGDVMYFDNAFDSLWVTDGSAGGAKLVDLPDGLYVGSVFDVAGTPYYAGTTDGNTTHLFETDGTAAGTVEVGPPSPAVDFTHELTVAGGRVFFMARDSRGEELWAMSL